MAAGGSSIWKGLFLPPFFALLLYLLISYLLLPLLTRWRSRQRTTQRSLTRSVIDRLPSSLTDRVASFFPYRRQSTSSGGSLLGDEELEEGFLDVDSELHGQRGGRREEAEEEGRLSRDLEGGFRDESSDEEEDEGRRGRLERG